MNRYSALFFLLFFPVLTLASCTDSSSRAPKIEGMTFIPAGEFIMGTNEVDTEGLGREFGVRTGQFYASEKPERTETTDVFYIDTYEVTNAEYKAFVDSTNYIVPSHWKNRVYPEGEAKHPVSNVTWFDAHNYCVWAGKRLPTEAEWEKAARGPNGNIYPWGNEWNSDNGNFDSGETRPVGSHPKDKSYYGVYDMGGNVMEWVEDWFKRYPGNEADIKDYGEKNKVIRGGSGSVLGHYVMEQIYAKSFFRQFYIPDGAGSDGGFRCAKSVEVSEAAGSR